MQRIRPWTWAVGALLSLAAVAPARAQAYCALRDPVQTIYALYPTATSFRSIVATVGEHARADIARQLGIELHHDELGRHTLYVALQRGEPIGLVHVRSERTKWGLAEVAWALDFDLHVVDFRIQRSRGSGRAVLERDDFRARLRGGTAEALAQLVATSRVDGVVAGHQLTSDAHDLAVAVLTSGMKAIAASRHVWGADIARLRTSGPDAR